MLTSWNALWQQACLSQTLQSVAAMLPCFDGELRLVHWWKTVHSVSTKQLRRYEVLCLASQKLNHLASSECQCIVLLEGVKVKVSLQARKCDRSGRFLGLQQWYFNSEPDEIYHQIRVVFLNVILALPCIDNTRKIAASAFRVFQCFRQTGKLTICCKLILFCAAFLAKLCNYWPFKQKLIATILSVVVYSVWQRKHILKFFCHFLSNTKFHVLITCLCSRSGAKGHAIIFNYNKITNFFL